MRSLTSCSLGGDSLIFVPDGRNPFSFKIKLVKHHPADPFHLNLLSEFSPVGLRGSHFARLLSVDLLQVAEQKSGKAQTQVTQHTEFGLLTKLCKGKTAFEGFK